MDARRERFIERMGLMAEADGLPRIAGRILGYLLITPGECSLDDLATELGVSRASVSNDARRLVQIGVLERRSRPGDRRDYYTLSPDGFRHSIESRIANMRQFHVLIDEARSLSDGSAELEARLTMWDRAHSMMLTALEGILAELDAKGAS